MSPDCEHRRGDQRPTNRLAVKRVCSSHQAEVLCLSVRLLAAVGVGGSSGGQIHAPRLTGIARRTAVARRVSISFARLSVIPLPSRNAAGLFGGRYAAGQIEVHSGRSNSSSSLRLRGFNFAAVIDLSSVRVDCRSHFVRLVLLRARGQERPASFWACWATVGIPVAIHPLIAASRPQSVSSFPRSRHLVRSDPFIIMPYARVSGVGSPRDLISPLSTGGNV